MSEEKNVFPDRTRLKLMKLWFYGDNQQIRTRTNLMTHNETASRSSTLFSDRTVKSFSVSFSSVENDNEVNLLLRLSNKKYLKDIKSKSRYQRPNGSAY